MKTLSVYIASSARNLVAVQLLRDRLRGLGCLVSDWTMLAPPLSPQLTPEQRRRALGADERGAIFEFCSGACGRSDLVIYLGPAGQDVGIEVGMAWAAGVPVYGLAGPLEAPGTMLARAVSRWFDDVAGLLKAVEELAGEEVWAE